MKKIIFVLSMLVSVAAYSQTTGFFRYDSVRFEKVGANSEFILLNATRNISGGVLTNLGNGRTAFVTPAATTKAINGTTLSLSGDTVLLGGNVLNRYTVIPLNGFPLTINHNGVNNAARSDSNSLRFSNNTLATSSTDSLVSPALIFSTSGWKATPPTAASQNVQFILDALGKSGSGTANGLFRIGVRVNNAAAITNLYSVDRLGVWQQNFNIGGIIFGGGTGVGGVAIGTGSPLQLQNTSASGNIAIGTSALAVLTGGMHNLAIGNNALLSSVNDTFNVAIGTNALGFNNGGDLNTVVGYRAMASNSTGSQNTAFGSNALTANTTGQKNSAIGPGVMESNTTGSFNTGNGHDALLNQTTGSNNVGIGWLAYGNNITGSLNTVVGFNSFNGVVNGEQNVIIGASATALNDSIDNAIGIGTGVVIPASNAIVIGRASNTTNYQFGIAAGAGTKALRYDPTTRQLFYADTTTGGGGSPQGLQSVLTVDPVLVGSNTITIPNTETLTINGNNAGSGFVVNVNSKERILAANAHTIITGGTGGTSPNQSAISVGDSIYMLPYQGKLNIDSLRSGYIDTTNYKPLARKVSLGGVPGGDVVQMNSWAQVAGGGAPGGSDTYLQYNNAGAFAGSGNMYFDGSRVVFGTTAQIGQGAASGAAVGGATYASIGADWVVLRPSWLTGSSSSGLQAVYFNGSAWASAFEYGFTSGGTATNMSILPAAGQLGIGVARASVTAQLHTSGTVRMANFGAGTATFDASGNISSVSDGRLKNIVGDYKAGLKEIMQLNPIIYTWKKGSGMETVHEYAGLDAREVYKVFGDLGSGENSEGYRTVQDRALIAALINSVKELQARVEYLENKLK